MNDGPIFRDVARAEEVRLEAQRCGGCNQECMSGCPVKINIPHMMDLLKDGYFEEAGKLLVENNPSAPICGRLCNAPCKKACPKDIDIKAIEKFLGDQYAPSLEKGKKNKLKIAIVGAGVSGLTAAEEFVKKGYEVTVFDATESAGGFVNHFVSDKFFPTKLKDKFVQRVLEHCNFIPHTIIGTTIHADELAEQFDAVVLSTGANSPTALGIPGEELNHVYTPSEYIRGAVPSSKARTVVVGGDEIALGIARLAAKKGDEVTLLDRRSQNALEVDPSVLSAASDEGIRFMLLTQPVRILGDKKVEAIESLQMMVTQSEFDDSFISSPIEDSNFSLECDRVIVCVGFDPNPSMHSTHPELRTVGKGRIWLDENMMTTIPGVFACGGIALGNVSPARKIAHARRLVEKIDALLNAPADELLKEV